MATRHVTLSVTALNKLFIGASAEAGNHTASLSYVPGSMVMGAFANLWIRQHGIPQGSGNRHEFVELFHGSIRWPALMPEGGTFVPMSVQLCKYGSRRGDPKCLSQSRDLLFDSPTGQCANCSGPMEGSKGAFWNTRQARVTRVALEMVDGRERAKDGQLYSRDGIPAGTELHGVISGDHPWLSSLAARTDGIDLWFGGARSVAGHCRARLATHVTDVIDGLQPTRDGRFADGRLDIRAESPCILVTDDGRPSSDPSMTELAATLGGEVTIERRWVRTGHVSGWHAASGLPRPTEIVALPGSVWTLRTDNPNATALDALQRGIGLRRAEGFGAITINPSRFDFAEPAVVEALHDPLIARRQHVVDRFPTTGGRRWAGDLLLEASGLKASGQAATFEAVVQPRAANRRLKEQQREVLRISMRDLDAGQLKRLAILVHNSKGEQ